MLGPLKPQRLDQPIAVSLEDLVPRDHFYRHLDTPRHDMLDTCLPSGVAERGVAAGLQSGSAAQRAHLLDAGGIPPHLAGARDQAAGVV